MKYILYIDYKTEYKPLTSEYRKLNAKTIDEAIIEADAIHSEKAMYLIKIMEKDGKMEQVEKGIKAQKYTAIMEKRTKWKRPESDHNASLFINTNAGEWITIL